MSPRIRAFLIHLTASAVVALLSMLVVFGVWYPDPLDKAVGVTHIFLVVLGVDVVVGPVLTFVVFKLGKPSLKFDIAVILLLQLSAFTYGVWKVAEGRPVWLVFSVDQFELVQAYQVDHRKQNESRSEFRSQPWRGPLWAAARRAGSKEERNSILMESLLAGVDIAQRPERYVPLADQKAEIQEHAKPINELKQYNSASLVDSALRSWPEANAYLPMMAKVHPVTVLIDKVSAQVIAIVDLNPWVP